MWLAKSKHILPFQVWHGGDQPIDINAYPIKKEKTSQLYFVMITSPWAKRSQKQNSAKSCFLKGRKMYLPTLIARTIPCTKVQWIMWAVCHQQTPLSYTAEIRKVNIFCHFMPRQYQSMPITWRDVKTCRYHKSTTNKVKHQGIMTNEHEQK
jgi:hypothetical protein